jgi:hypothetical protein
MKRKSFLIGLGLLMLAGCSTPNQTNSTVGGGVLGGLLGLGIGSIARNPGAGLAIGAASGAIAGNVVGREQDRRQEKQAQAAAQAYAAANPKVSAEEIIDMSNKGIAPAVIIQQIATTGSYYSLTSYDIEHLNQCNVHPSVIMEMQRRRVPPAVVVGPPAPVVVGPPPGPPVYVGPPPAVGVGVIVR